MSLVRCHLVLFSNLCTIMGHGESPIVFCSRCVLGISGEEFGRGDFGENAVHVKA